MYAVRRQDGRQVCLKLCPETRPSFSDDPDRPAEIQSYVFFSSEPQRSDPRNRCCPLLDLFRTPVVDGRRHFIVVLPLLRDLTSPLPTTVEESVHCILSLAEVNIAIQTPSRQLNMIVMKGLAYMHEHNFAHRCVSAVELLVCAHSSSEIHTLATPSWMLLGSYILDGIPSCPFGHTSWGQHFQSSSCPTRCHDPRRKSTFTS